MKIKDLPKVDLPREKLEKYGTSKLHDHELLAILLGSGIKGFNVLQLSKKILKTISEIGKDKIALSDLLKIKGLGKAKASQIIAVLELGKRLHLNQNPEILSAEDVWKLCADIRESKKEHFIAFYLDTQNRLIERQIISIGTLNASLVHPREVFEPAVRLSVASIIVAHNHPSGEIKPSDEDREVTKRLSEAGKLLGITLTDHVIVTKPGHLSFQQKHLL
ncbi:MAG TPA: DNA repair protein RadC [Candidatus Paceibacterota bacterium]|nr:DNA repair protein RadC [Candidatus Paceibacterota bacterium]